MKNRFQVLTHIIPQSVSHVTHPTKYIWHVINSIENFPAVKIIRSKIGPEAPEEKSFEILNIFPIQMHKEAKLTLP